MAINNSKGFTLIELLVVVAIIAILSSVALASFSVVRAKGRAGKFVEEIKSFQNALNLYKTNHGQFPWELQGYYGDDYGLATDLQGLITDRLLPSIPHYSGYDPNSNSFAYSDHAYIYYVTNYYDPSFSQQYFCGDIPPSMNALNGIVNSWKGNITSGGILLMDADPTVNLKLVKNDYYCYLWNGTSYCYPDYISDQYDTWYCAPF